VDLFCVKYLSSAGERVAIVVVSCVFVVSCLPLVVALVAVYYRRRLALAADDGDDENERHVDVVSGRPVSSGRFRLGDGVRMNFPSNDDDDNNDER